MDTFWYWWPNVGIHIPACHTFLKRWQSNTATFALQKAIRLDQQLPLIQTHERLMVCWCTVKPIKYKQNKLYCKILHPSMCIMEWDLEVGTEFHSFTQKSLIRYLQQKLAFSFKKKERKNRKFSVWHNASKSSYANEWNHILNKEGCYCYSWENQVHFSVR